MERGSVAGWVVLELEGREPFGGRVDEGTWCGLAFGRVEVPDPAGEGFTTMWFDPWTVRAMTETTEEVARSVGRPEGV